LLVPFCIGNILVMLPVILSSLILFVFYFWLIY